jgi:hypothetical protein
MKTQDIINKMHSLSQPRKKHKTSAYVRVAINNQVNSLIEELEDDFEYEEHGTGESR